MSIRNIFKIFATIFSVLIFSSISSISLAAESNIKNQTSESNTDLLPPDFIDWYNHSDNNKKFTEFELFLKKEGAHGVFPTWQLLISDSQYNIGDCHADKFILPPKKYWKNSVKTIKFLRNYIIPKVGSIRIMSGYRPREFNECLGGAKNSKHLEFGAFDLAPLEYPVGDELFNKLCSIWRNTKSEYNFGLGAYWDVAGLIKNPDGRFHVDTLGKRTWGYDFTHKTSFCLNHK